MPLFDLSPKDTPDALFGRAAELDQLARLVNEGRWAVVLGPRMVGKTSLIKAAARRIHRPVVYVNLWGATGIRGFIDAFVLGLNSNRRLLGRIRGRLRGLEGVSIGPAGISVAAPKRQLRTVWDLLNVIGSEAGNSVIELDELQEISAATGPILKMLANLFNARPEIGFVFTGSRFGLVRTLLDPKPSSPLFGRSPAELRLKPFGHDSSVDFLERGFAEYSLESSRSELGSLVDRALDGIPGWLALYGNHVAVERLSPEVAEGRTVEEGKKVARDELNHFLEGRSAANYWPALRILVGGATWSEVRQVLTSRRGSTVNDHTVGGILESLEAASLLAHTGDRYELSDPMVRAYVASSSRRLVGDHH